MEITSADFIISSSEFNKLPPPLHPEYAFIGRSNVGKSSLINMLCQRKGLAKTSARPGKTQLINHFLINKNWFLVDLPGYGFAQVSKTQRKQFERMIDDYLLRRSTLVTIFLLLDSRHDPMEIDLAFIQHLATSQLPFCMVFTKADKCTQSGLIRTQAAWDKKLHETWDELPPRFITSAESGLGREPILQYIQQLNQSLGVVSKI
ncbi:MAG: ribosome biogenesis GTP-binding protein YihA/YsxC [Bacteroidetes bacterium]|nr:ribosome biogenesis GTP-binding protein YihA/YsxC [Bacteroidota bacterium]